MSGSRTSGAMAQKVRRIHMVGIGGGGMSAIAEVLLNLGYEVWGSDLSEGDAVRRLRSHGAHIFVGHEAEQVRDADVVVISSAVPSTNPEVVAARAAKTPVIQRAEMLAELMRLELGIAIAGSHGKTTTTSMVGGILHHAGLDPTVVVGGKLNSVGSGAQLGKGPYLVAEADESDGSFVHLSPTIAVVTNIDAEHLDHYAGGLDEVREAFRAFLARLPFYGLAILCGDHPDVQALLPGLERRVTTYGLNPQAELRAVDVRFEGPETTFEVLGPEGSRGRHRLHMLGEHNVLNALAALAVADELGVPPEVARAGLEAFSGVDRRFSERGEARGIRVVDDYGHHPEEIRATLRGARQGYPDRRLVAVFQPHRYSRTAHLLQDFGRAFHDAETVYVLPVYAAGEAPIVGAGQAEVIAALRDHGHRDVRSLEGLQSATELLLDELRSGDLVIAFGAGDVGRLGRALIAALEGPQAE